MRGGVCRVGGSAKGERVGRTCLSWSVRMLRREISDVGHRVLLAVREVRWDSPGASIQEPEGPASVTGASDLPDEGSL